MERIYYREYKPNLPPEQWVDIYKRLGELKCMEGVSPIHIRICVEVIENHRSTGELHRLAQADENFQWLRSMQGNPMSIRQIQNILFRYFPEFQRPNRKRKQPKNAAIRKEETAIKREINQNVCHRCGSTEKLEIHHMIPVKYGRWISISEKMPPDLQDVIVSDGNFIATGYFMNFMEMWHIYGNSIPQHKEAYTYWQPLPEPPERNDNT